MSDIRTTNTSNVTLYDESGNVVAIAPGGTPSAILPIQGYQPAATTQSGITATGAQAAVTGTGYNICTLTLRTFTGTTPSVTWKLQASDDNTNWVDLQGINNSSGLVGTSWTQASALTAGSAGPSIDYTIGAYTEVRINVTAISGTSATAAFGVALQSMPYEASPGVTSHGFDGTNPQRIKTDTAGNSLVRGLASTLSSGLLVAKVLSAANTTPFQVKTSAGQIYGWHLINNATSVRYVRIFNVSSAPTMGTTSPYFVLPLPASGGAVLTPTDVGIPFSTGCFYAITTGAADLDNTAGAANDVVGTFWYA